jgi:hypothetical protein
MNFDVFNGDADGICALHQLRLDSPVESELVTGPKRDIALLGRVHAGRGDHVTVLDIALGKNREALDALLQNGATVEYFDHHIPGEIPDHPNLRAVIDTSADVCTSLLVNQRLQGRFCVWAVVAAFGDNLEQPALRAAQPLHLAQAQLDALRELGECINYNGYGESVEDLYFHPAELYRMVHRHADPFGFMRDEPAFQTLRAGYSEDMALAAAVRPDSETAAGAIYILPDAAWSRRVSGVFGNHLASAAPARAHAVFTRNSRGGFVVSVRAPLATRSGADELCRRFETGGGRKGAAGINHLPEDEVERFVALFNSTFGGSA